MLAETFSATVEIDLRLFQQAVVVGAEEAHRQQDEIGLDLELTARNFHHPHPIIRTFRPFQTNAFQRLDPAARSDRTSGGHGEVALAAFLLG